MSWTNRMARHGSERSLHSLSISSSRSSGQAAVAAAGSPQAGSTPSTPANTLASSTPLTPSPTSTENSRIPRPSPAPLRRAGSLRVRGERTLGHQHHRTPGSAAQHLQGNSRHPQEFFPAITENGVSSPRHRSLSLSLTPVRPRHSNAAASLGADDSDADSLKSFGSACSTASACDHALFALNGTTWSGKSRKYVVHCSNHNGDTERYLTPTQRAARQIRKLQALLNDAKKDIEEKDREIFRLAKEVVELRLYKASLNSPDDRTDSSDALTIRENNPLSPESPCKDLPDEGSLKSPTNPESPEKINSSDLPSSLADSGHFEDSSIHSKDSACFPAVNNNNFSNAREIRERDEDRRRIVNLYESRIEEMHRNHIDELQALKQKHNDKVESLLTQLSELNIRYCEVRPTMDAAEAHSRELETELEAVKKELADQKAIVDDQEERNKQMYLKMYAKGQEAARIEQADQILEQAHQTPSKVSVPELLQQLTITKAELENIKDTSYTPEPHISADSSKSLLSAKEAVSLWVLGVRKAMYRRIVESRSSQGTLDPEITLQFLKSAVYYFLTDRENHNGHLNAIESILGFNETEKLNIDKLYRSLRK